MKSLRVFITGGTGFIGSHIVNKLSNRGHAVSVLSRNPLLHEALGRLTNVDIVRGDLELKLDYHDLLVGHDVVIHNAIVWGQEPSEFDLLDSRSTVQLFQASERVGIRHFVYTSSTAVHRPFQPVMNEEIALFPSDFYGATKAANEDLLSALSRESKTALTVIRPGPVIGLPWKKNAPQKFDKRFGQILEAVSNGNPVFVCPRDGRQFIGVLDLASVFLTVIESASPAGTYLATSENYTTWTLIAEEMADILHTTANIRCSAETDSTSHLFDVSKLYRKFGIRLDSALAMTLHLEGLARAVLGANNCDNQS